MMEWRVRLVVCVCCAIATAVACTGSEGTGDDDDDGAATAGARPLAGSSAGGSSAGSSVGGRAGAPTAGSGGPGVAGSGGSGVAGSGTGGSGTGGTVGTECVDTELPLCLDDTNIRACFDGAYETFSCPDFCENTLHFEAGPCDTAINDCACGDPQSPECALGTNALCFCLQEAGEPCTDVDAFSAYIACYEEDADLNPLVTCFGEQVVDDGMGNLDIDCSAAATACFPAAETPEMP